MAWLLESQLLRPLLSFLQPFTLDDLMVGVYMQDNYAGAEPDGVLCKRLTGEA